LAQASQNESASSLRTVKQLYQYNMWLGIPAALLSAIIGTSIFATLKQDVVMWVKITAGVTSLTAAALASLQTVLKFSEHASQHHDVAASYGAINRSIEVAQAFPPNSKEQAQALMLDLQKRMDDLPKQAPAIPDRLWKNTPLHLTPEKSARLR
jgi:hypothetical protein